MAEKKEKSSEALSSLQKKYGAGVIVKATDPAVFESANEVISTGSISLDAAIGIGGIPIGGKTICLLGLEGSAKTTLMYTTIANAQRQGKRVVLIDVENSLDHTYASAIGINLDELDVVNSKALLKALGVKDRSMVSGEEYADVITELIAGGEYAIVAVDSCAAFLPMAELQNGVASAQLARQGQLFSKAYRQWQNALNNAPHTSLYYIGQYRQNPNAYVSQQESLGSSLKYLQTVKIELSKSVDKDANGAYGIIVKFKITKNKVGIPFKTGEFYVEFGKGIVREYEIMNMAIEAGLIKRQGAWYQIESLETKLNGESNVISFLESNPEFAEELLSKAKNNV